MNNMHPRMNNMNNNYTSSQIPSIKTNCACCINRAALPLPHTIFRELTTLISQSWFSCGCLYPGETGFESIGFCGWRKTGVKRSEHWTNSIHMWQQAGMSNLGHNCGNDKPSHYCAIFAADAKLLTNDTINLVIAIAIIENCVRTKRTFARME